MSFKSRLKNIEKKYTKKFNKNDKQIKKAIQTGKIQKPK